MPLLPVYISIYFTAVFRTDRQQWCQFLHLLFSRAAIKQGVILGHQRGIPQGFGESLVSLWPTCWSMASFPLKFAVNIHERQSMNLNTFADPSTISLESLSGQIFHLWTRNIGQACALKHGRPQKYNAQLIHNQALVDRSSHYSHYSFLLYFGCFLFTPQTLAAWLQE